MTLYDLDPKGNSESARGGEANLGNPINGIINMYLAKTENDGMWTNTVIRDENEIKSNFRHEIGHIQGLQHPWEESLSDIKQPPFSEIEYNSNEINKFRTNVMNSMANECGILRPLSYGNDTITDGQRQKAKETILNKWNELELKPKPLSPLQ